MSLSMLSPQPNTLRWILKPPLFLLCLLPAILLVIGLLNNNLGVNPVETLTHKTGEWGLRFLLITLAITPLRQLTGMHWLLRLRRMLGLFAFFYVSAHFFIYIYLDHLFDLRTVWMDVVKRPYITVGFIGFVLLIPLAVTSFGFIQRNMGRHWVTLHRLVYIIGILGVVHFWWLVKADIREPLIYAVILGILLGWRVVYRIKAALSS